MVIVCLCGLWTLPHAIAAKCTHETYQRQGYSHDLGESQIRQALGVDLLRGDAVEGRRHRAPALRRVEQAQHEADADAPGHDDGRAGEEARQDMIIVVVGALL